MNAAGIRLRASLEEYVRSIAGDTGSRRSAGLRRQINQEDRELVELSQTLLGRLGGGESTENVVDRDTPGARARNRVSTGGQTMESARTSARALLGANATNGPAGAPAGGGNDQGGTP